ncbi:MAG TPA: cyclic nucleotide-binding domain-containing protein [Geminicoccaceae bacterium]|nr:cyclic nucleotide-binding domain-containing protein [Geminicoccaceae bacterium]
MRRTSFQPGQTVFAQGDASNYAYFIISGKIEIALDTAQGRTPLSALGAGEVFGEMGLIESGPRSATATALEDTRCLALDAEELLGLLESDPKEAVVFVRTLIHRLREANRRLAQGGV